MNDRGVELSQREDTQTKQVRWIGAKNNEVYVGHNEFEVPASPQLSLFHKHSFSFQRLSIWTGLLGLFCQSGFTRNPQSSVPCLASIFFSKYT